jgi:hypothetical protein
MFILLSLMPDDFTCQLGKSVGYIFMCQPGICSNIYSGVISGKFLGAVIQTRKIKVNMS